MVMKTLAKLLTNTLREMSSVFDLDKTRDPEFIRKQAMFKRVKQCVEQKLELGVRVRSPVGGSDRAESRTE